MIEQPTGPVWSLYVLERDGGALYTGISPAVSRRLRDHLAGRGARALRGAQTLVLRYQCEIGTRSLAQRVEYRVKRLSRPAKLALLRESPGVNVLLQQLGLDP